MYPFTCIHLNGKETGKLGNWETGKLGNWERKIPDIMSMAACIRIRTRGGIYDEIWPEPKGVPEGAARGNSRGLRPYFAVYPESSPNTDIISFLKVTLWPFSVLPSEVGLYWKS